jgi:hypothetical protein
MLGTTGAQSATFSSFAEVAAPFVVMCCADHATDLIVRQNVKFAPRFVRHAT